MIKTKIWIAVISVIAVIAVVLSVIIFTLPKSNVVEIYSDGKLVRTVDLTAVTEPFTITVESQYGFNEILVEHGRIRVADADCPDRCCVDYGWYEGGAAPVVCVPHKLIIRAANVNYDAVAG